MKPNKYITSTTNQYTHRVDESLLAADWDSRFEINQVGQLFRLTKRCFFNTPGIEFTFYIFSDQARRLISRLGLQMTKYGGVQKWKLRKEKTSA